MYEEMDYNYIMTQLLNRIPTDIDKREGSILWNAIAPAAMELANVYIGLDMILEEAFADTASMEYLVKRAAERGIFPEQETNAVLRGVFNCEVPIDSRFSLGNLNYKVIAKISDFEYNLVCETAGTIGNSHFGTLTPVNYIQGLETAQLTELLIPGEDDEDVDQLRERYFQSVDARTFGGNIADYKDIISKIQGIGKSKIYPVWNGGGTVKIVFTDSTHNSPSEELVEKVQEELDPDSTGNGMGMVPIGHKVTALGAETVTVNISATVIYDTGYTFESLKERMKDAVENYFMELRKAWADTDYIIVRVARIEMALLTVAGVIDVKETAINASVENIELLPNQIPVLGGFNE